MSLKTIVNDKEVYDAFLEVLDEYIALEHSRLVAADNVVELHRAQGAVNAYKKLKHLREKVNGPRRSD
jgi:hypothetical protein